LESPEEEKSVNYEEVEEEVSGRYWVSKDFWSGCQEI